MCNIAGYVGGRRAAPILLEMLEKQRLYDGGCETGIATVSNGKLYTAKVVGDLDVLLKTTDAAEFPGTVGIIHSRPGGDRVEHAHPFLTENGATAVVSNCCMPRDAYTEERSRLAAMLSEEGYTFSSAYHDMDSSWPRLPDGRYVHDTEFLAHLIAHFREGGKRGYAEAISTAFSATRHDLATLVLSANAPDRVFAARFSRPIFFMTAGEESFLASTPEAFPETVNGTWQSLPLFHACEITPGVANVTKFRPTCEDVAEFTPFTYAEGYRRVCEFLRGRRENAKIFDDLEIKAARDWRDLLPRECRLTQLPRLIYEILYELRREGILRRYVGEDSRGVKRYRMYLDD